MPTKKPGELTSTTAVIYIGSSRYQLLAQDAREISYLTESNVKTTTFLHYLIDEYTEKAKASLLKQLALPPTEIQDDNGVLPDTPNNE